MSQSTDKFFMNTTLEKISFNYAEVDKALFRNEQERNWKEIEKYYVKLRALCKDKLKLTVQGNHKEWITQRVEMHMITSLVRLLYLTESFRDASLSFNSPAAAVHVKAMTEIPLHLGHLLWVLKKKTKFEDVREELKNITWGTRDEKTGLTTYASISQKTLYTRADEMFEELFKDQPSTIKLVETIYKESNATGHHNYEGRNILTGVQNDDFWRIKDRKEWFVFLSSNIFPFFLHSATVLHISYVFVRAIDFYLKQLPDKLK